MQRESSGHLVLVGSYSSDEKPHAAEERARHEYDYLTGEKGIDSQRIELRVGDSGHRSVANVFVPAGATYAPDNSRPIDPTSK
jgi:hypothetical protein